MLNVKRTFFFLKNNIFHFCLGKYSFSGLVGRVFANGPGDLGSIPGCVIPKILKMELIPPCLTLSNIRYVSRVKWSNPGKGVAPSPTPQCSSYWKGSLLIALNYSCQLYFYILFNSISTFYRLFHTDIWLICKCLIIITNNIFIVPFQSEFFWARGGYNNVNTVL